MVAITYRNILQGERQTSRHVRDHLATDSSGVVDMWWGDDRSGRQRWQLEPVAGAYRIKILDGTNPGETYLSCTDGNLVDLFDRDDGSGRQRWRMGAPPGVTDGVYLIPGGVTGTKYLSIVGHDRGVTLIDYPNAEGRNIWYFVLPGTVSDVRAENLPQIVGLHNTGSTPFYGKVVWNSGGSYSLTVQPGEIKGFEFDRKRLPAAGEPCWIRYMDGNTQTDSPDNFSWNQTFIQPIGYDFRTIEGHAHFNRTL